MISVRFQGKPFNITVIQVYVPTSNTEQGEVERFYEVLQDLLLAQRFPASSVLALEGAGCGSVGDVPGAWLASAPLSPSLWT